MLWSLCKANVKGARILWVTMLATFILYYVVILSMYDPESTQALEQILELFPETLLRVFGMERVGATLLGFVAIYMYGIQLLMYPMAASIVINHRLVAAHVDKGSMAYLLSTPNTRKKIITTQVFFSVGSIALYFAVVTFLGLGFAQIMLPGEMDVGGFILLNLYALVMYLAVGGMGFLASCAALDGRTSLGFGIGIPAAFLVLQMMGDAGEKFGWVGNLSLYNLFRPESVVQRDNFAYLGMALLFIIAALLYGSGVIFFDRRDFHV